MVLRCRGGRSYEAYGTQRNNVAEKCIFCFDRVDEGELSWCVEVCPMAARIFGDLDDPDSEINAYIAENNAERSDHLVLLCEGQP